MFNCQPPRRAFLFGDVRKRNGRPFDLTVLQQGERCISHRERRPIGTPENLVIHSATPAVAQYLVNGTLPGWIGRAVRMAMVCERVHILAACLLGPDAEHPGTGVVEEGAVAFTVDAINPFARGFQKQPVVSAQPFAGGDIAKEKHGDQDDHKDDDGADSNDERHVGKPITGLSWQAYHLRTGAPWPVSDEPEGWPKPQADSVSGPGTWSRSWRRLCAAA